MNGTAAPSGSLMAGAFSDVPSFVDPYFEAHWTATDIPDPDVSPYNQHSLSCGFIDTPACASS
ncbi:hypothetical protein D3C83_331680 [compost metagenome]